MKLSEYPTPQVDELWKKTGTMSNAQQPIWDLATQLEKKLAKLRHDAEAILGYLPNMEPIRAAKHSEMNRLSWQFRKTLEETK